MRACAISPADQREQMRVVGNDLIKHYGKQRYYSPDQVRQANQRQGVSVDVACWSHAAFNTHVDFDAFHAEMGETCDYVGMKRDMLESVSASQDANSVFDFDIDLSWLEFPSIDLNIFDFFDF